MSTEENQIHIHNEVKLDSGKAWNIAITLMTAAGITAIGYQLSLGPLKEVAATGISIFLTTLVGNMFKAGILRLPERQEDDDDLSFTKGTLRRIYDEVTAAIIKSTVPRLILFSAISTVGFLLLRAAVSAGLGLLSGMWMAIGVGLLLGALIIAQDQILAWLRRMNEKKGAN